MFSVKRWAVVLSVALAAGCASYYQVTDPTTGKQYYTKKVKQEGSAVQFTDAKTGAKTTLQNSEVLEVDEAAYKAGIAGK